ncbi:MAG: hypothetical protein ACI89L_001656 [Phycisphaerales bacterium]|jgi:hypothetical protein
MRSELLAALLATAIVCTAPASAQTATTFTYQGHLAQNGTPVDGAYEFEVRLLDGVGSQIGSTQAALAMVSAGAFTMSLDFGVAAFDGDSRFLEISVRSFDVGGAYTTLSPNQSVASTPVAQFALSGNEGPAGPQGATGPQGDPGNDGAPGIDGTDGAVGPQGPDGPQGLQGNQGVQGSQGVQGDPGTPGDSHWSLNGAATYYTAGEVGIGITNPGFPLHVLADGLGGPVIYAEATGEGSTGVWGKATGTTYISKGVRGDSASVTGIGVYGFASSLTGFANGVMGNTHSVDGAGVYGIASNSNGRNYGVYGKTNSPAGSGVFGHASADGGAGEGVLGLSESTTGIGVQGFAFTLSGTNYGVWGKTNSASGYAGYFTGGRNYFQGKLGAGVTAPTDQLHINAPAGVDAFRIQTNGSTRLRVNSSGGVSIGGNSTVVAAGNTYIVNSLGIGDSTPEATLDVAGNAVISSNLTVGTLTPQSTFTLAVAGSAGKAGGGSWSIFSDRRLKSNIAPMTGSLDTIAALRPVNFEYNNTEHFSYLPGVQRGFIAQEVQGVIPQWVHTADDGYLYLDQIGYEALIVDAIQELRAEKDTENRKLRDKMNSLVAQKDREIEGLTARLERLEKRMERSGNP